MKMLYYLFFDKDIIQIDIFQRKLFDVKQFKEMIVVQAFGSSTVQGMFAELHL